jgi:hypothetical protein
VGFEVDRFEWISDGRIEVTGRWFGLRGHRFLRPTLDVDVGGERRRMLADLEHKPWAPEEGEAWTAAFTWRGQPARFDDAELTVAPELAIKLPAPDNALEEVAGPEPRERLAAGPPRTAVLESERDAALVEVQRLSDELARAEAAHAAATDDLRDRLEAERAKARGLESQVAEAEAHARLEIESLRAERDAGLAAGEALREQLEAAEHERAVLAEQRDKARQERNAWMSKAHAAATGVPAAPDEAPVAVEKPPRVADVKELPSAAPTPEPAPEPAPARPAPSPERRTIQIGERPGPLHARAPLSPERTLPPSRNGFSPGFFAVWGPRLAALAALLVLLAIVAVILTLAF